ncbi:hypothetical protein AQUCO_00600389v1 [Aquilegia coerulea]|uniref:Prolyl endopeptidase n=1 Tax=Aquilegia coerulea TaxID=218851 RepID=A0A2G5EPJ0_AQUCA|nr:hypothetical protein AQUCO_00600389v1 [Aquilegia coerulea]
MASLTFLTHRITISKFHLLPLSFHLIPHLSFSSFCKKNHFSSPSSTPPIPKRIPFEVSIHGKTWQDPYHWMSNTKDPDLLTYLNQENSYTEAFMADTVNLQKILFEEMKSRMPPEISTPPELWGPWLYYQYIPEGKEFPVLCRKLATQNDGWVNKLWRYAKGELATHQVLLDWNKIAEKFGYVHIGTCRVSPDHNFLAYTLDTSGSEQFILQISNLRTGSIFPKVQVHAVVSLAWAQDSQTLFYTVSDDTQRPYRVLCTKMDSDTVDSVPIYTESDPSFCVYVVDANNPHDGLQSVWKREHGTQFFLEHHYGNFYILTNAPLSGHDNMAGGSYYMAICKAKDIQSAKWQNIILPSQDFSFQDMDIVDKHLVLFLAKLGSPMICSINLPFEQNAYELKIDDLRSWYFPLPSNVSGVVPGSNHDFMTSIYRVVLSSPVMPDIIVDYDMSKRNSSIVQQEEVVGVSNSYRSTPLSFDADGENDLVMPNNNEQHAKNIELEQRWKDLSEAFSCERREVISHDGVSVPMTILSSRKARQRNQSPGILLGYGAYGECLDISWCADRLSLLDRGWIVAFADVRGGGRSPSWHKAATGLHKANSVHDFVACAHYLINEGYVHNDRLCAVGHSAGGLLVGAAINMHPHLFCATILKVPFLDVCNTLLDSSLPLTILDYEEFGNPQNQKEFEYIHGYSPYDNIPTGVCSPPMLITASFQDSRVGVWEAAKWVAKVREKTCPRCSHSVILKTDITGGHFGEGGRFSQCEVVAFEYAFLMKVTGMYDIND